MSQKYVEIWEASKSSRNVLNIGICWQLKVYTWIFLIGFGYLGVLNTQFKSSCFNHRHAIGNSYIRQFMTLRKSPATNSLQTPRHDNTR